MNVIIVDASEKKAAVRSRRELSKWLSQLGADTYAGRLSEEGLKDLIVALRASASRNTAIAVHRVVTRDRIELVTVIGSRQQFDAEGRWAFRTKTRPMRASSTTSVLRLLSLAATLSGLCHDLGKVNRQLQGSLRGVCGAQRIRHDVLGGVMVWCALGAHLKQAGMSDAQWLSKGCEDPTSLFSGLIRPEDGTILLQNPFPKQGANVKETDFSALFKAESSAQSVREAFLENRLFSAALRNKAPVFVTVVWLTLTHHHLIRKVRKNIGDVDRNEYSLWRHIQEQLPMDAEANLKAPTTGLPWQDPSWCSTFKSVCTELLALITTNPEVLTSLTYDSGTSLLATSAHVLRPALILADQAVSVMQQDVLRNQGKGLPFEDGVLYANSWGHQGLAGDTLATHLLNVGKKSRFVAQQLLAPDENFFNTADGPDKFSGSAMAKDIDRHSKFYWQQQAQLAVQAVPGHEEMPFFAAVLSAPGTGKTIGGPRLLSAASGEKLRFTLAVGRRSLTLQTGKSYENDLKFQKKDLAVMVGDPGARMLFEAENAAIESDATSAPPPQLGSECLTDDAEDFLLEGTLAELAEQVRTPGAWLNAIQPRHKITSGSGIFDDKRIRLIDAPVLVATVDHLMGAASLLKTRESHLMLRISSSDLILDEIDDYSTKDLVPLAKLIFVYGLFGRRVILMSGTLNEYLAQQLYAAWSKGLKVHRQLTGKATPSLVALVSSAKDTVLMQEPDAAEFEMRAHQFCTEFAQALTQQNSKAKLGLLSLPATSKNEAAAWPEALTQATFKLHHNHAVVDPETGVRISIGAVRFNRVRSAQALAKHLLNRAPADSEPYLKVACYHAKYPTLLRALMEQKLDSMLSRRNLNSEAAQEFAEHAVIREALRECAGQGYTDLVLILSTTSIEETGRDHDLDWAITEPHSERSAAQLAGRLLRHRDKHPKDANLLVLEYPVSVLEGTAGDKPYGRTGVQDNETFKHAQDWLVDHPLEGSELETKLLKSKVQYVRSLKRNERAIRAEQVLPFNTWNGSVTPATTLLAPTSYEERRLATLQYFEMRAAFEDGEGPRNSVSSYFDSAKPSNATHPQWLTSVHTELFPFRDTSSFDQEVGLNPKDKNSFYLVDPNTRLLSQKVTHLEESFAHPERDLLKLAENWEQDFEALCEKQGWSSASALYVLGKGKTPWPSDQAVALLAKNQPVFSYTPYTGFSHLPKTTKASSQL